MYIVVMATRNMNDFPVHIQPKAIFACNDDEHDKAIKAALEAIFTDENHHLFDLENAENHLRLLLKLKTTVWPSVNLVSLDGRTELSVAITKLPADRIYPTCRICGSHHNVVDDF